MAKRIEKLHKRGVTLVSIGGLIVVLSLTMWKQNEWGLELSVLAFILAISGIYFINKAKGEEISEGK